MVEHHIVKYQVGQKVITLFLSALDMVSSDVTAQTGVPPHAAGLAAIEVFRTLLDAAEKQLGVEVSEDVQNLNTEGGSDDPLVS